MAPGQRALRLAAIAVAYVAFVFTPEKL